MSSIKLRSADGVLIDLEMDAAKFFRTLIKMMDDMGGTTDLEAIHLDRVKFAVLHKLVEWANYHKVSLHDSILSGCILSCHIIKMIHSRKFPGSKIILFVFIKG